MLVEKPITEEKILIVVDHPDQLGLDDASLVYTEWLVTEDKQKANYMQETKWTPIYWEIKKQDKLVSHEALIVLGRVLGYCQMERGHCDASQQKIADEVMMSLSTVKRCMKILTVRGYLNDLTPLRQRTPHAYAPTEKLNRILRKSGVRMNQD